MKKVEAEIAYDHIEKLCAHGPRNVNAPGDLKSIDYISGVLEQYDFEIRDRPFDVGIYKEKTSDLTIEVDGEKTPMECVSHYRSGNTPPSGMTAAIEYVGCGTEEEVSAKDVTDKFLLADTGKIHPVSKADVAKNHGAAGCIWIHGSPGHIIAAWGLHRFGAPLPVIGISYEDGEKLKELLGKTPVHADMTVEASVEKGKGRNIIGYKEGKKADEIIALCAHRETTHTTPGANDNASGVSVLLETAKVFADEPLERSMALLFSTGEEGGGFGVEDYLGSYPDEAQQFKVAINLDMVGEGSKLRLVEKGRKSAAEKYTFTSHWLNSLLKKTAHTLGFHIGEDIICEYGLADAGHFLDKDIHATWFYKPDDPYFHTKEDTPDKVNPNDLKATGDIVVHSLQEMDKVKEIPSYRGE
jgi:aminopeptidase YwaD